MNIILYTRFCRRVGRQLAKELGIDGFRTPTQKAIKTAEKIIRWGYFEPIPSNALQINTRDAILLASRKYSTLQTLDSNGIPVPDFWLDTPFENKSIGNFVDDAGRVKDKIILGRSFQHTGGKDIEILKPGDSVIPHRHDYYMEYMKPHKEWRVHIFDGKAIFAQKKFFSGENPDEKQAIIRNYDNGWRFHTLKDLSNLPKACLDASIRAVNALGLTFGAVDVISHGRDENGLRKAFILETNTAPGLDEINLPYYVEQFRRWL